MLYEQLQMIRAAYRDAGTNDQTSRANYEKMLDAFEMQWQASPASPIAEMDYSRNLVGGGLGFNNPPRTMRDRISLARTYIASADYLPPAAGEAIADNLLALHRTTQAGALAPMAALVAAVHAAVLSGNL